MADGGFQGPDPQTLWGWIAAALVTFGSAAWGVITRAAKVSRMAQEARDMANENKAAIADVHECVHEVSGDVREMRGQMDILIKSLEKSK